MKTLLCVRILSKMCEGGVCFFGDVDWCACVGVCRVHVRCKVMCKLGKTGGRFPLASGWGGIANLFALIESEIAMILHICFVHAFQKFEKC